ncbi:MAG TPA: nucleoside monophosphate kinase [Candidatus Limnocylindrales bacterium]
MIEPGSPAIGGGAGAGFRVIVLLGAPGAGKGTQGEVLAEHLGLPRIATGDLFRAAVSEGTPLGLEVRQYMDRGELVPDQLTVRMLLRRLAQRDAARGAILDGFPRSEAQAGALDAALAECGLRVELAPFIEVPAEDLSARLSGRWMCRAAGHTYHERAKPPSRPGLCDIDGSPLYQRDDDRPEVVRARLDNQLGALAEVVEYYRSRGVLRAVDGRQSIDAVSRDLLAAVGARDEAGV